MKKFKIIIACLWTGSAVIGISQVCNGEAPPAVAYVITAISVLIYAWDEVFS